MLDARVVTPQSYVTVLDIRVVAPVEVRHSALHSCSYTSKLHHSARHSCCYTCRGTSQCSTLV